MVIAGLAAAAAAVAVLAEKPCCLPFTGLDRLLRTAACNI